MNKVMRLRALAQAWFVSLFWSLSTIVAVQGVTTVPPLRLAGLSCVVAFLLLLPLAVRDVHLGVSTRPVRGEMWRLVGLAVCQYVLATGGPFFAFKFLPATTVQLVLALTPALVAVAGSVVLAERPSLRQWGGIALCLLGVLAFFSPWQHPEISTLGVTLALLGTVGAAGGNVLARTLNREQHLSAAVITTVSLGIGAALLLGVSFTESGTWMMSPGAWAAVAWLGMVNTALATLLLNVSLRTLTALEVSVVLNTTVVQVALLAWLVLRQPLGPLPAISLLVVIVGAVLVQLPGVRRVPSMDASRESGRTSR